MRDSFSDFVLFKEKFWHDKSVVYHHLVGFIHFYLRSLRCHFRVFRVQFLFIFPTWASCFTSPLVCYPILLASFSLFLCVVVVVVCTVFFYSLFHLSRVLLDKLIFKLLPDYQVVVCLPHILHAQTPGDRVKEMQTQRYSNISQPKYMFILNKQITTRWNQIHSNNGDNENRCTLIKLHKKTVYWKPK